MIPPHIDDPWLMGTLIGLVLVIVYHLLCKLWQFVKWTWRQAHRFIMWRRDRAALKYIPGLFGDGK